MRTFTINGKTCWLTERQYSRLLQRFDLDNAVKWNGGYFIHAPCICPTTATTIACSPCPFKVFELVYRRTREVGCIALLRSLGIGVSSIDWRVSHLAWLAGAEPYTDDVETRKAINQIREHLLSLKRVERRLKEAEKAVLDPL